MLRTFIRNASGKASHVGGAVSYEPVPINTFNQARSAFNIKPKKTQGLVYNPPASISKPSIKTANAFLPEQDPRKSLVVGKQYTKEELENYPIINRYEAAGNRSYEITPDIVEKLISLRKQDPAQWTISKLSKEFDIPQNKVNVLTGTLEKEMDEEVLTARQLSKKMNKKKRSLLWLRGEF